MPAMVRQSSRDVAPPLRSAEARLSRSLSNIATGLAMLLRILDRLEEVIIATLIAAATLLIFVAVVHRYGTGVPFLFPILHPIHLSWAQELCIYMFIWMAKFGAAYGVRTGIHVGV